MAGDHSLATEDGSRCSLPGNHALPVEETLTLSMAGDPWTIVCRVIKAIA